MCPTNSPTSICHVPITYYLSRAQETKNRYRVRWCLTVKATILWVLFIDGVTPSTLESKLAGPQSPLLHNLLVLTGLGSCRGEAEAKLVQRKFTELVRYLLTSLAPRFGLLERDGESWYWDSDITSAFFPKTEDGPTMVTMWLKDLGFGDWWESSAVGCLADGLLELGLEQRDASATTRVESAEKRKGLHAQRRKRKRETRRRNKMGGSV